MITNQEVYKTAESRQKAFCEFCSSQHCTFCPLSINNPCDCRFLWLEMPAEIKLKPCPFCGGEAVLDVYKDCGVVSCKSCSMVMQTGDDGLSAAAKWNHRSPIKPTADNADDDWDDCFL